MRPDEWRTVDRSLSALVIEDDCDVADFFTRVLQSANFRVTVTNSGEDGAAAARQGVFSAVVLDMRLPDVDGLDILQLLRVTQPDARIVLVSGHLTVAATIEAIKRGANNVLEKPVMSGQLVASVAAPIVTSEKQAPHTGTDDLWRMMGSPGRYHHSVAHRWATYVMKGSVADVDSKTLEGWARSVGASVTTIGESCRMLGIKPHDARDLTRALCAMRRGGRLRCSPSVLLDVVDARTLRAFSRKAGPDFQPALDPDSINGFLNSQSFVDPMNQGVTALRQSLIRWRA